MGLCQSVGLAVLLLVCELIIIVKVKKDEVGGESIDDLCRFLSNTIPIIE